MNSAMEKTQQTEITCPCCSAVPFSDCCEPFLSGTILPDSPEALMRSRFSAYATVNVDYLLETTHPKTRSYYSPLSIRQWAEENKWLKLEVIETMANKVRFKAHFEDGKGIQHVHREHSTFKLESGKWYFFDGDVD